MTIKEVGIYHIYNRGNNQQPIFFRERNYDYFVEKCHKYLKPLSHILAWCLMPNHFHFLIDVTKESLIPIRSGGIFMPQLTNGFRLLQSSYAKGINKQENRSGNLFQQKTKAKLVSGETDYSIIAFNYIHFNPVRAGLSSGRNSWKYSSFNEYCHAYEDSLSDYKKGIEILRLSAADFISDAPYVYNEEIINKLFV